MTHTNDEHTLRDAFRPIRALIACYIGLGLIGLAVTIALRDHPDLVNTTVWVRTVVVVVTSGLMYMFALRAARGDRRAHLRLRIATIAVPLAIVVLIALPDPFPVWMKAQQGLCALAVAGAAVLANRPSLRALVAAG